MAEATPSPISPFEWHRRPASDSSAGKCSICGCPWGKLSSREQLHQRIAGDVPSWKARHSALSVVPSHASACRIRKAAWLRASGMTLSEASRRSGLTPNALHTLRLRYPEFWQEQFDRAQRAHRETFGGRAEPSTIEEDPGLNNSRRKRIRKAIALLAAGMEIADVRDKLGLAKTTLREWKANYPVFWNRTFAEARAKNPGAAKRVATSLVEPEEPAAPLPEISQEMTLREFYRAYVLPVCLEPKFPRPATLRQYAGSLALWAEYTNDPRLKDITPRLAAGFVRWLQTRPDKARGGRISPNTVRKHCITLQFIIDRAGPQTRANRMGVGLLTNVIYLERPRSRPKPPVDTYTLDEIAAWLDACRFARWPRARKFATLSRTDAEWLPELPPPVPAPDWWRSLVVFIYNTGLRIGTVLSLTWPMVDGHWLNVPGDIYKGGYGKRFWLNDQALAAAASIRTTADHLFPWPFTETVLHRCRRVLLAKSRIPAHRRFGFHALRKATATELARVNPAVATLVCGHTGERMTREHYLAPDIVCGILANIPQPTSTRAV